MIDGKMVSRFDILGNKNIHDDKQIRRNGVGLACTRQQLEISNLDRPPGE